MFAAHRAGPKSIVVDLGAGTGQFALAAARHVAERSAMMTRGVPHAVATGERAAERVPPRRRA
jgi:predicted RNA methylase